ncbi:hypothetical protein [Falsiroseomonas oryzae]|uniref:hypothetical protein n=1 Tax=Falsiroseomonas oryzae TaxID=2766473 RepID=UPI0022EB3040|nr:hypothetical protein [Roseomonas sp. MO-31]
MPQGLGGVLREFPADERSQTKQTANRRTVLPHRDKDAALRMVARIIACECGTGE